jgi:hypothetical protein
MIRIGVEIRKERGWDVGGRFWKIRWIGDNIEL